MNLYRSLLLSDLAHILAPLRAVVKRVIVSPLTSWPRRTDPLSNLNIYHQTNSCMILVFSIVAFTLPLLLLILFVKLRTIYSSSPSFDWSLRCTQKQLSLLRFVALFHNSASSSHFFFTFYGSHSHTTIKRALILRRHSQNWW